MVLNTFLIILLISFALFLCQIAVQFIKIEKKLESSIEVLEEELIDVFGSNSLLKKEAEEMKNKEETTENK